MLIKINRKNKDRKRRNQFLTNEMKKRYYKFMIINTIKEKDNLSFIKYYKSLAKLPKTLINNYCYITGRSRGVYSNFKLSRHQIREKFRYLNGMMNSSW